MTVSADATVSADYVLAGSKRTVFLLLTVNTDGAIIAPKEGSRGVGFIIDVSGSMGEFAASGKTKLEEAKAAVIQAILELTDTDTVSVYTFDGGVYHPVQTIIVGSNKNDAIQKIQGLRPGGMTCIAPAIEPTNIRPGMNWRNFLLTDGQSTIDPDGDEKRCLALVSMPQAVPIGVLGLGISYNDVFLQRLASVGQPGSFYQHVADASDLSAIFGEQMQILTSSGTVTELTISFMAINGVKILEAVRLVPDQREITVSGPKVKYHHGILDGVYGQKVFIKMELPDGLSLGRFKLGDWNITYSDNGRSANQNGGVFVQVTDNEALTEQIDQGVINTFLTIQATRHTQRGEYGRAATLMTRAGNQAVADQLNTLASGNPDKNELRTIKTLLPNLGKGTGK